MSGKPDSQLTFDEVAELWELSEDERKSLRTLIERLNDVSHEKANPMDITRYMRARPDSLDDAEAMFRAMVKWRADVGADTILEDWEPPLPRRHCRTAALPATCPRCLPPARAACHLKRPTHRGGARR